MPEQEGQEPLSPADRAPLQWVPVEPYATSGGLDGPDDGGADQLPPLFGPEGEPPDWEPRRRHRWRGAGAAAALVILALGAGSFASALGGALNPVHQAQRQGAYQPPSVASGQADQSQLLQVASQDLPEIVTIVAVGAESEELGTGWPIDNRGDFITNDHVVHDGLSLHAVTASGDQFPAVVLNADPSLDLAEVRVVGLTEHPFPMATGKAVMGEPVVVLAAKGATSHTPVTESEVNGLDEQASVQDAEPGELSNYSDLLRIPARIFPGNSGGPVLTDHGAVLGILTLAAENGSGAFATPLSEVHSVIEQWLQD